MRSRPLSASSIKTFLQCWLKYYYQYEDKKPKEGKADHLALGVAVHEALEYVFNVVSKRNEPLDKETYEKVLEVFSDSAVKHGLSNISMYQDGKDLLIRRLDSIDPAEKVLGLEWRFEFKTPKGTPFTGSIDKIIELDEETVVVVDYKTSSLSLTQDEADFDIQLSMYDLAVSLQYPKYKTILLVLDYLKLPEVISYRTPEQRSTFVGFLDSIHKTICSLEKKDIKATLNAFCGWCEYKNWCPDHAKVINDPDLVSPRIDGLDNDNFVQAWELVSSAKRIIETRQRELKDEAYRRMRGGRPVKGKQKELYSTQQTRMSYDTKAIYEAVGPEQFVKLVSINKSSVDRFLRDNPNYKEKVEKNSSFSLISPAFKSRNLTKDFVEAPEIKSAEENPED